MNSFKRVAMLLGFALLLGCIFIQNTRMQKLAADNTRLAGNLRAAQQVEVPAADSNEEELQRLRNQEKELLKLRGEVNVLRRQLQEAKAQKMAAQTDTTATTEVAEPIKRFQAMAEITLQPGETAVTGGWETSPGKNTLVFATPTIIGDSIQISTRFVELPGAMFSSLGLGHANEQEALKGTFTGDRMRALLKQFEEDQTVISLAAPRMITSNGQQAQVSVLELKTIDGTRFEVGPTLDVLPTKQADGSIQMVLVPSLAFENAAFTR